MLAIAGAGLFQASSGTLGAALPPPRWNNVEHPHPAFELSMPELATGPANYAILRGSADGARKDLLSWGGASGPGPFVMVEIYRPSGAEHFRDAPSEVAARLVDFPITDDVKPAGAIDSKFGAVSLVDFAIAPDGRERRCLGFAHPFDKPVMQIAGWYCSAGREVVERTTVSCAIDRLSMISAGGNSQLDELFARAELKRNFCGQHSTILAATPERDKAAVEMQHAKLRGRLRLQ